MPGPLDDFDRYEKASDRGKELIELELKRAYTRARERYWLNAFGLVAGFIVVIFFGTISYRLIMADHGVYGTILGGVDITALASIFVYAGSVYRQLPPTAPEPQQVPPGGS